MKRTILFSLLFVGLLISGLHAQNSAPPTITSVSPSQASPASNIVQVFIDGNNLQGVTASSFVFSPGGIPVSNVQAATDGSSVAADFNVCGATPGTYNFTLSTAGGTSNPAAFTVTQSGPVINDTMPRSNAPGTSFLITILGCALQNTEAIFAQTTGVSFSNISSTGTQVTANMAIDSSTPTGQFFLSVANPVGTSNSILFDVVNGTPQPSLSSLSPASEPAGTTFTLTLNGSSLSNASGITFSPSTAISTSITQNSDSQIKAVVTIDASVTAGNYVVTVTTPGGTSNGLIFTVSAGGGGGNSPTISSISPSSVAAGTAFTLTINGSGFQSGATAYINGKGLQTTFVSSGKLTASVLSSEVATAGNKSITVTNPGNGNGNTSNSVTLTVH